MGKVNKKMMFSIIFYMLVNILYFATQTFAYVVFDTYQTIYTGPLAGAVAIADLNNDGRNDVVMVSMNDGVPSNSNKVYVFYQTSTGSLLTPQKYAGGTGRSVVLSDVNNDNRLDIITTTNNGIGILYQNTAGGFDAMQTVPGPPSYWLKACDINNDGLIDIISLGFDTNTVEIYLQKNDGTFAAPISYSVNNRGWSSLEVADINNDGLTDIVVKTGQGDEGNIAILYQKPDGTLATPVYLSWGIAGAGGVAIGDLTSDGAKDIVASKGVISGIIFYEQNGGYGWKPPLTLTSLSAGEPIKLANLNQAVFPQIITMYSSGDPFRSAVIVETFDSSTLKQEITPFIIPSYGYLWQNDQLAIGDINGDGLPDIVIANNYHGLGVLKQTTLQCEYTLPVKEANVSSWSEQGFFEIKTNDARCSWYIQSNDYWIRSRVYAYDDQIGSGTETIFFEVSRNDNEALRTGSISIQGQIFNITQIGCTVNLSPIALNFGPSGGARSFRVDTATEGCQWKISGSSPWINVHTQAGSGTSDVTITVAPYSGNSARVGTLTIGSKTVTVAQSGSNCTYAASPSQISLNAGYSTGKIIITSPPGCYWSAGNDAPAWLVVYPDAGIGSDTISISANANATGAQREALVTVEGQSISITQKPCLFTLGTSESIFFKTGGTGSVTVAPTNSDSCGWTAVSNVPWISIASHYSNGTGRGVVVFMVTSNDSNINRSGTLTIGGRTFNVFQLANAGPGGDMIELGSPAYDFSTAVAMTPDGSKVIGYYHNDNFAIQRAFVWTKATGIIELPGLGGNATGASAITPDGRYVVGFANTSDGIYHAVRWEIPDYSKGTPSVLITNLGENTGYDTVAWYVSDFGDVIAGNYYISDSSGFYTKRSAFRWTAQDGMLDLGKLSENEAYTDVRGLTSDGSVIVGDSCGQKQYIFQCTAFSWTPAYGMREIIAYGGDTNVTGITPDGQKIIGSAYSPNDGITHAVLWKAVGALTDLGSSNSWFSAASLVSADGNVVVGVSSTATLSSGDLNYITYKWTLSSGMVDLGTLGEKYSMPIKMTPDGKVVIGNSYNSTPTGTDVRYYRWSAFGGMQSVEQWLANSGVSLGGLRLYGLSDISSDGNTIIGQLSNGHAFIASVAVACEDRLVKLGNSTSYYTAIQNTYSQASDNQPLYIQASTFSENISLAKNVQTVLKGGYNCDFSSNPSKSTISGSLTIKAGTAILDNLIIK